MQPNLMMFDYPGESLGDGTSTVTVQVAPIPFGLGDGFFARLMTMDDSTGSVVVAGVGPTREAALTDLRCKITVVQDWLSEVTAWTAKDSASRPTE